MGALQQIKLDIVNSFPYQEMIALGKQLIMRNYLVQFCKLRTYANFCD